jgi:hypothetical protein
MSKDPLVHRWYEATLMSTWPILPVVATDPTESTKNITLE